MSGPEDGLGSLDDGRDRPNNGTRKLDDGSDGPDEATSGRYEVVT